jgi:hypothetical protein
LILSCDRQVLKPCPRRVTEVEWQDLADEKVVRRAPPPGVASEPIVLEPHTGFSVPIIPWYVGRSTEARTELHVMDALTKSPWTPLVRRPAPVEVVVAVVAPPASMIVVVA